MTYTGTYTATFRPCTYTRPTDLHAAPVPERGRTYTDTYTTYTRPDLHARPPLYREGRGSVGACHDLLSMAWGWES